MKKFKVILYVLLGVILTVALLRFFVVDLLTVPRDENMPTPAKSEHVLVKRWSYGYRCPWNTRSRIGYKKAEKGDMLAYNIPEKSRNESVDTCQITIGICQAAPGDTLWYNNESGQIATKKDTKKGFTHLLTVPAKGAKVKITKDNIRFYEYTIGLYEPEKADIVNDSLCVSGKMVDHYTFQQDYYWVSSGNQKNLNDSRTYGFIPMRYVIGKVRELNF